MTGNKLTAKSWLGVLAAMGLIILAGAGLARAELVHFKQLIPLVDLKWAGWEMTGKPTGTTMKQGEISMSEARATYRRGDQSLDIVILDFMGKAMPFMALGQQLEMETSEESIRSTTIQGFKGLETFRTKEHHGELNLNVADRFWVKIDGNGIDNLEVLRAVAKQMNLTKLAELAK
jgi:hypothetical protein